MKEWRVYSKPEPGKEKGGVIICTGATEGRLASVLAAGSSAGTRQS